MIRAGWGEGEQVAAGRWLHARELPGRARARRRRPGRRARTAPCARRSASRRCSAHARAACCARSSRCGPAWTSMRAAPRHAAVELDRALRPPSRAEGGGPPGPRGPDRRARAAVQGRLRAGVRGADAVGRTSRTSRPSRMRWAAFRRRCEREPPPGSAPDEPCRGRRCVVSSARAGAELAGLCTRVPQSRQLVHHVAAAASRRRARPAACAPCVMIATCPPACERQQRQPGDRVDLERGADAQQQIGALAQRAGAQQRPDGEHLAEQDDVRA